MAYAGRNQRVLLVRVKGHVRGRIDGVLANAISLLHQGIQVVPRGMHGHPPGMISPIGTVHAANELDGGILGKGPVFEAAMEPYLVGLQVGRVEIRF